jgi:hypothetical protein
MAEPARITSLRGLAVALAALCFALPAPTARAAPVPPSGIRGRIVTLARTQLGYRDQGHFCSRFGPCEEWCSLFATWVWRGAGIAIGSLPFTGSMYDWSALHSYVLGAEAAPRPGDAVLFGTGPANVDTSLHVGIVEAVYPRYLVTIEGDTSHRVLRFVVPLDHTTRIGEPGPIYAYASPVRGSPAGAFRAAAPRKLSRPALRLAIANQAARHRLTPTDRRLRSTIRSLRAFQHMPYRAPGLSIDWGGVNGFGQVEVTVTSRDSLASAQAVWQSFLARWQDPGRAYHVSYQAAAGPAQRSG